MRCIHVLGLLALALPPMLGAGPDAAPVDQVNPIIGTTGPMGVVNYGGVCPWVTPPHGMTHWTPMTQENEISRLPYRNEQRTIVGFMATHQPTVWMSDYGFLTLMPEMGARKVRTAERGLQIVPGTENARPDYYSVELYSGNGGRIRTEMTASERCGFFQFNFPAPVERRLFVEISRVADYKGWIKISPNHREIEGYNPGRQNEFKGRPMGPPLNNFKGYYVLQFEVPFASANAWGVPIPGSDPGSKAMLEEHPSEIEGERVGAFIKFSDTPAGVVRVRIGSSFISLEQARENLRREIPDWDFAALQQRTRAKWTEALGRLEIRGGSVDERTVFYTAMYHCLLFPRAFDEYGHYYSAFDDQVHAGVSYNDFSMWDTFRALHPLLTLIAPEHVNPMIRSLVQMYEEGGWMPKWPNPSYTNIMIGTPADAIIADAFTKRFRGYDLGRGYAAMYKDAMTPPDGDLHNRWQDRAPWTSYEARAGLSYYKELGFVPADRTSESVSCTLEYAFEDYCVAQVAKGLGKDEDYRFFMERSKNYKNVFNRATGMMQARLSDGTFFAGDPKKYHAFTEGSPWTYLFCVMHDIPGLIELMGRDKFIEKLDENFSGGHYAYDNEPENHYPYLYDWVDQPEKTQRILTAVVQKNYRNTPDGITGNDDCGQMSAWYIFTALGFYPVAPGSATYAIGRPFFPEITLHLTFPRVKDFKVVARNMGPENNYVRSVSLDGRRLSKPFLTQADLEQGSVLEFEMAGSPAGP